MKLYSSLILGFGYDLSSKEKNRWFAKQLRNKNVMETLPNRINFMKNACFLRKTGIFLEKKHSISGKRTISQSKSRERSP